MMSYDTWNKSAKSESPSLSSVSLSGHLKSKKKKKPTTQKTQKQNKT